MRATLKFDYDWKDAYSTHASATVELTGDGDPVDAIKQLDNHIEYETANDYVAFVPETVNGEGADFGDRELFWTTMACLEHLKKHPEVRKFSLEGRME